ncbi:MAG: peptidylprolyl isomerase [Bacteroidetes bacterium]|nr:peptidylprolyl isomerase [Bacteroidota bacterium]
MKKNQIQLLIMFIFSIGLISCSSSKKDIVVAEFENQKVSLEEFENVYAKNNGGYEAAKADSLAKKKNFLDLYVNFKMKIHDARKRGVDQLPDVVGEFTDYKSKIGVSYLLEKTLVDPNIKELYEKRKEELRVSHIMFRPDTAGEEGAFQRAKTVLDSIKMGKSFEEMAKNYSQDFYSAPNGGDIFYITAGEIIPSFEDACYALKKGEIYPEPVKTQFGYHLIKVTDRKPRTPEIRASHILIQLKPESTSEDSAKALELITAIKDKVKLGEDFNELAKELSDDEGSKSTGGDLGYFTRRMMVQPFDEAAHNLKIGEVSDIVVTPFGYHLIKLVDRKPIKTLDEEKEVLKGIYQRIKYNEDHKNLVDSLKKAFNYYLNPEIFDLVEQYADTTEVGEKYWSSDLKKKIGNSVVFTYAEEVMSLDSVMAHAEGLPDYVNRKINKALFEALVNKLAETAVLQKSVDYLPLKYPQFSELMEEYKNGILIFKLQEEEVWNKIEVNEEKLKAHYDATKEKYQWPDRVEYAEIFVKTDSLAQEIYLKNKNGEEFDTLASQYTERPGYKEKHGHHGIKAVLDNQLSMKADQLKEGQVAEPIAHTNGFSIVKLIKKYPAGQKTFEEALPEVSGSLQELESKRLEKEYLDFLRSNYKPEINYDKLEKAFAE